MLRLKVSPGQRRRPNLWNGVEIRNAVVILIMNFTKENVFTSSERH